MTASRTSRCSEKTPGTRRAKSKGERLTHSNGPDQEKPTKNKRARGKLVDVLLVFAFLFGLVILLYPAISNYINTLHQGRAIAQYDEAVAGMSQEDFDAQWQAVDSYNKDLLKNRSRMHPSREQLDYYKSLLNVTDDSMMGHLEIKKLRVSLPIYHTVDDAVLQAGVGHIPGTSLPGGGPGTHVALSGHRGLPTARLFTDLDQLVEGDRFVLHVLDRSLTYEVDQIRVVEPQEINTLSIDPDRDYVTLVTCTPYAINTHRLLVRGHRVEGGEQDYVAADAVTVDPILVSSVVSVPIFVILFGIFIFGFGRHSTRRSVTYQHKRSRK